ncbi:APC family permease [Nonomuraea sp. NPDC049400]|uniref:APC family permease n=1 Tax=Nonomuraea sp. NPDC049400 TaxID=3364352 RepID=UPI0037AE97AE
MPDELARRLGTTDAVVVGLSAMIGAGVFAAFAPAAGAAGHWLLLALVLAAVVAYCNATSSARLAALYPESGGTYVYGRRRLGPLWGYLAGWGFTIGKTASCAAMALTFGAYIAPELARPLAVGAVAALTALSVFGVRRSTGVAKVIVAFVLAVLAAVVVAGLFGDDTVTFGWFAYTPLSESPYGPATAPLGPERFDVWGVLQAAGLLFFAFAGYARIATLGEEVRDPARTIPRAVGIALGITFVVYTLVAMAALRALGPLLLARSPAPLAEVVREAGAAWLVPVVGAGAAAAALGALLALLLGVSRTVLAMGRERDLPGVLAAVDPVRQVPRRAELAVGGAVIVLLLVADLREAIGFSSFGVLVYYGIANACALTLRPDEGAPPKPVPALGLALCVLLAATLPSSSVLAGLAVFAVGLVVWLVRHRTGRRRAV